MLEKKNMKRSLIGLLGLAQLILCSLPAKAEVEPYPYHLARITLTEKLVIEQDREVVSLAVDGSEMYHFLQQQIEEQGIFFLSVELPWTLVPERVLVTDYQHVSEDGENYYVPMESAEYFLPDLAGFEQGFNRKRMFRFSESTQYQGYYQAFKMHCFSSICSYQLRLVSPEPERAAATYKAVYPLLEGSYVTDPDFRLLDVIYED
ncbi:hypothetical protein VB10N_34740 [Vibrio sp. 10N]|nr:hypothetical protein VB10N_34740 [Vibrio sp. 10N]